jgi:hypothetical protein
LDPVAISLHNQALGEIREVARALALKASDSTCVAASPGAEHLFMQIGSRRLRD